MLSTERSAMVTIVDAVDAVDVVDVAGICVYITPRVCTTSGYAVDPAAIRG